MGFPVGMTITFLYMGTFGALPYFLTVLFQNVQGFTALQTGLAFLVPSFAIVAGTQAGERLATRLSTRTTLVGGTILGAIGTAMLVIGVGANSPYLAIVPGLVLSGIGQGIVWTGMWIAAASGVHHDEQGVASGMASTALSIGNAIGLAVLIAIANRHVGGLTGEAQRAAVAAGIRIAFWLAAAGIVPYWVYIVVMGRMVRGARAGHLLDESAPGGACGRAILTAVEVVACSRSPTT